MTLSDTNQTQTSPHFTKSLFKTFPTEKESLTSVVSSRVLHPDLNSNETTKQSNLRASSSFSEPVNRERTLSHGLPMSSQRSQICPPSSLEQRQHTRDHIREVADAALRLARDGSSDSFNLISSKGIQSPGHDFTMELGECNMQVGASSTAKLHQAQTPLSPSPQGQASSLRLNKFVRRLHDMLIAEKDSGIVEWRRGLLVLQSTDAFATQLLPKYFNTRNFKTFRRQLNYYGFVHVRSFSTTGSTTTALWVNRELAQATSNDDISSVLLLKRVEPCESAKTAEGRRVRKELAISTVEDDLGVSAKTLQIQQIKSMTASAMNYHDGTVKNTAPPTGQLCATDSNKKNPGTFRAPVPLEIHCPPMPLTDHHRSLTVSSAVSDFGYEDCDHHQYHPRNSCDGATHDTVGIVSHGYSSADDESASAANLLLMLSRTQ